MHFFEKHIAVALTLIEAYNASVPLSVYLKKHFAQHKKYGSKDRKQIAHICYCYYRLGFALAELLPKERAMAAVYLCTSEAGDWLLSYDDEWRNAFANELEKRLLFVQSKHPFVTSDIFHFTSWLSRDIHVQEFCVSHLIQPDLFLRVRPGYTKSVTSKLSGNHIAFREISEHCIALSNATKIEPILSLNKEVVVQDASSQNIATFFTQLAMPAQPAVWDCCAASGGKSILAFDHLPKISLTVSDIRSSIIHNLQQRFLQAGIKGFRTFVADVSTPGYTHHQQYDLVICDVPCSGSGTWSRSPEQLPFFTESKLAHYTALQAKITANTVKAVKPGGYFLYITCSVFRQENEEIAASVAAVKGMKLLKAEVLKGYNKRADTMYAALFRKEA